MKHMGTHTDWIDAIAQLRKRGSDHVLITVLGARGSTPRDDGTKMVVAADASYGTIGGGHLELRAMQIAADMLRQDEPRQHIEYFPLGPALGQCCGGSASVLFESFKGNRLDIAVFGAGHVGSTLVPILQQLPCQIRWVDSREKFLSSASDSNVITVFSDDPAAEVEHSPANCVYIIMTHNHQQDFDILQAVLRRGDARYVGLIGSATKWRRFQMRMQHRGLEPDYYQHVRCPIGLEEVPGKRPIEVAISIAAEVVALQHRDRPPRGTQRGVSLAELKPAIRELQTGETGP
ncbi:MAG: xanthine dehydrogenase accessory protein XdhC [Gammaproteobacteria bacterium]|nr:xanthine dehydrogenase accessory protein XdhC [Gammaproteobacteria bacterium]